jgi:excisionase family DNA binding protein
VPNEDTMTKTSTRSTRALQRNQTTYESVDELAKELGISRQAAYAALHRGVIPSIRIGKRFVLPRAAIAEWLRTAGNQALQ